MERNIYKIGKELFITNDEEIKEGDWVYVKTPNIYGGNVVARCLSFGKHCWSENILTATTDEKGYHPSHCVKIIMTTDQDLIKDGVQAIPDEFLEWYVKNPSCEEVETYSLGVKNQLTGESGHYKYEIIIPKEEPTEEAKQRAKNYMSLKGALEPKQETLEEAAEKHLQKWRLLNNIHLSNILHAERCKNDFMAGAKWQQEKMYSEEEVKHIISEALQSALVKVDLEQWFKQFSKLKNG